MNRRHAVSVVLLVAALLIAAAAATRSSDTTRPSSSNSNDQQSIAPFREVAAVLQSPRCMNCHVKGDRPRQGDDRHLHAQNVMRGPEGKGLPGLRCSNCHQSANNDSAGGPPGAADWQMPSAAHPMAWEGLSVGDLCGAISDPEHNGHRKVADLVPHMRTSLVVWAWTPGPERTSPPLSYDQFMSEVREWIATGAVCEK